MLIATVGTQKFSRFKGALLKREKFVEFAKREAFSVVADVRTEGGKAKTVWGGDYAWFRESLAYEFNKAGITFVVLPDLGAPRKIRSEDRETFRQNYLKHIQSPEAQSQILILLECLEQRKRVLCFCAERKVGECHREFLSDYLEANYAISVKHY